MHLGNMSVQKTKGSYFIYIPKIWAKEMKLEKGTKVNCSIDENDHQTLRLKKLEGK